MRIGLFTDGLGHRSRGDVLDWLEAELPGVRDLEIGTGGYSPAPHCDLATLLRSAGARRAWFSELEDRGFWLAALNVSGNPLHPDDELARRHGAALRGTIRLAALVGVERVVAMSGCPAAAQGNRGAPHFSGGGWLPDLEGVVERQWRERVLPFWLELAEFARAEHEALRICFELHPGTCVYNVETFGWISKLGPNLAVNVDPSHLLWQGMDPLAVVRRLGADVAFAHGKDTLVIPENLALNGALDCRWPGEAKQMPWNFSTVGRGHDPAWWRAFVEELRHAGYDGVISIEYEDPFLPPEQSIAEAARVLEEAISEAERTGSAPRVSA